MFVRVDKYSYYQNPKNYERNSERNSEDNKKTTSLLHDKQELKNVNKRSSSIYIEFNFEDGKFNNIPKDDLERWEKAYPACSIQIELHQMAEWLLSNPEKQKKN